MDVIITLLFSPLFTIAKTHRGEGDLGDDDGHDGGHDAHEGVQGLDGLGHGGEGVVHDLADEEDVVQGDGVPEGAEEREHGGGHGVAAQKLPGAADEHQRASDEEPAAGPWRLLTQTHWWEEGDAAVALIIQGTAFPFFMKEINVSTWAAEKYQHVCTAPSPPTPKICAPDEQHELLARGIELAGVDQRLDARRHGEGDEGERGGARDITANRDARGLDSQWDSVMKRGQRSIQYSSGAC